ncbi:MAG TPA: hypothetical protein VMU29_11920 [Smithella sp.]|nr:hypothetical protein [Smithella sp.]
MKKKKVRCNHFLLFVRTRKCFIAITIAAVFLNIPSMALGAVQCYCRGQYYNFNDDRNCRDWCVGSQPSSGYSPQPSYTPPENNDNSWQQQQEEDTQRKIAEDKKKQDEFLKRKTDALNEMKGTDSGKLDLQGFDEGGKLNLKDMTDTDANIKHKEKSDSEKLRKGWQKALGCAMQEVYGRAEALGKNGKNFSAELREEMTGVFNEAGQPVQNKDDVNIVNFSMHREGQTGKSSFDQFAVNIVVGTHDDGSIQISVESYLSKSAGKKDKHADLQSILIVDKHGKVIQSDVSKSVRKCLAR